MASKAVSFEKFLYAVFFEKNTGKILLIGVDHWLTLPGGKVLREDISKFIDERWKRGFFCYKIPDQTGITAYFIEEKVQSIPATYEVYQSGLIEEHSTIIVGEIDPFFVTNPNAKFYDIDEIKGFVEEGRISVSQELLIWRALASRDCHNPTFRSKAGTLLKEKHK